jgi:hypothetical protein
MGSKLLNLYKLAMDFYADSENPQGLEIGVSSQDFNQIKEETLALAPKNYNNNTKELVFNTPAGKIMIYEKV